MLIYGSCAAKHWFKEFRTPSDVEYIGKEFDWVSSFSYILENNKHNQYVDRNFLLTIKVSHAAWDIKWDKTMKDIVFFLEHGCQLDKTLYTLLYSDWKYVHREKRVKLSTENDKFFTNNITRSIPHDELHEILAFYNRPLHESIRKDLNSPKCDENLFNLLSENDKINCALEEIRVIATERYLSAKVPFQYAKYKALKTLITSATTGWFNLFLILNFKQLIYSENITWEHKLLKAGLVK